MFCRFTRQIPRLTIRPLNRLRMPHAISSVPPNSKVLGAYATSKANTLKLLFLVLFSLIFKASKA
jgi:hypothetical protein